MSDPKSGTSSTPDSIHWRSLIAAMASIAAVGIAIGLGLPLLSIIMEKRGIPTTTTPERLPLNRASSPACVNSIGRPSLTGLIKSSTRPYTRT